jgi:hypothetical protein
MAFRKRFPTGLPKQRGYRSGLEDTISGHLQRQGVPFEYEGVRIPYIGKPHTYTPDFLLANGIVVETKGLFTGADRAKHLLVQAQHPDIEIRFVFTRSATRLSKTSKTTYGAWCQKHGFQYADTAIPAAWLIEADNAASLAAIQQLKAQAR